LKDFLASSLGRPGKVFEKALIFKIKRKNVSLKKMHFSNLPEKHSDQSDFFKKNVQTLALFSRFLQNLQALKTGCECMNVCAYVRVRTFA